MPPTPPNPSPHDVAYWRAVIRLTLGSLAVWALVSIVAAILLVRPLNHFHVGALPAGFWMAQQGSILVFVVLIGVYARRMDRIDRTHKAVTQDDNGEGAGQ